jgi:hypothetical protein
MLEHILTGPKIHYTELGPARPDDPNGLAWETYRREVARLIAEGHEGKYVLLHDDEIAGIYESWEDAKREGLLRFCVNGRHSMIRHILTYEATIKLSPRIAAMYAK